MGASHLPARPVSVLKAKPYIKLPVPKPIEVRYAHLIRPPVTQPPKPAPAKPVFRPVGRSEQPILVYSDMKHIGDTVLGMQVVAGLRQQHPRPKLLVCVMDHSAGRYWSRFFLDADLYVSGGEAKARFRGAGVRHFHYRNAVQAASLVEDWALQARCTPFTPHMADISTDRPPEFNTAKRNVVLCPWSASGEREWPAEYWSELEQLLLAAGLHVIVAGAASDRTRRSPFQTQAVYGLPGERLLPMFQQADGVIAVDSGPAHLAGVVGGRVLVLCGKSSGQFTFSHGYPRLTYLQAAYPCSPCFGQHSRGFTDGCKQNCKAIRTLTPALVFECFMKRLNPG